MVLPVPVRQLCRLASSLAVLLVVGCKQAPPPPPVDAPPVLEGMTVEIAAPAELAISERSRLALDEWQASTGGEFRLQEYMSAASVSPPAAETALAVVPLEQLPDLIAADWPATIDDPHALADWEDLFRGLRNGIAQPGGEPGVIPTACPVLAVYYRADLLDAAGRRPPRNWDEYQTLLDERDDWSRGLPALEPWGPEFRSSMWLARAASYALHPDSVSVLLDLQTADPLLSDPPFLLALEESLTAIKALDPQSLELGPEECCLAVLEGRAAIAIGTAPAGSTRSSEGVSGDVLLEADVGTALLPGASRVYERSTGAWQPVEQGSRTTLVGHRGYAACVSQSIAEDARKAAWSLWAALRMTGELDDLPFGAAICRASDVPAAQHEPAAGFTAIEWRRHVDASVSALQDTRVLLELPLPEAARFREKLTAPLSDAIEGTTPPAEALQQAANDWQTLIDELGRDKVLNVYRRCHGLMPL